MNQLHLGTETKFGTVILVGFEGGLYYMVMDENRRIKRVEASEIHEDMDKGQPLVPTSE